MVQRFEVIANLEHIVGVFGAVGGLEGEHILKRGLGALDLRGDDRFLADKPVKEPIGIGNHGPSHAKAGQRGQGFGMQGQQGAIWHQGRTLRRQRMRHEGANGFFAEMSRLVIPGGSSHAESRFLYQRNGLVKDS